MWAVQPAVSTAAAEQTTTVRRRYILAIAGELLRCLQVVGGQSGKLVVVHAQHLGDERRIDPIVFDLFQKLPMQPCRMLLKKKKSARKWSKQNYYFDDKRKDSDI